MDGLVFLWGFKIRQAYLLILIGYRVKNVLVVE
jgi:hypothetical protein